MRKYYHNVRVIHKPDEMRYDIELKKHWYSAWNYQSCIKYYETKPCGDAVFKQSEALKIAKQHAKNLVTWEIIYEFGEIK